MSQKRKDIPVNGNWALLAWWEELFCVIEELETIPPDLFTEDYWLNKQNYPDVGKASTTNTGGVLLYRLISDRQDPEQLRKVVESRMSQYAKQYPDVDLEFHILNENAKLNDCKNDLFKNWETNPNHYNNRKFIDAYIAIRDQIEDRPRPQNKPQTTAPEGWDQVFIDISDYHKFEYINEKYAQRKKVRWTHIYKTLKYNLNVTILSERNFFKWVGETYHDGKLSERHQQSTQIDPRIEAILSELRKVEKKLKDS